MNEATFLAALHDAPGDEVTWLALADWLEEDGQAERAELVRLIRRLRTVDVMKRSKARVATEKRVAELLAAGVKPAVPEIVNSIGLRLALIPAGDFRMGSPSNEYGRNVQEVPHAVTLTRPFYLGVFPVTQAQYGLVMGNNPSDFCSDGDFPGPVDGLAFDDFPVENVSWHDAMRFCRRLSKREGGRKAGRLYRLPTEAEWEYACRGGSASTTTFHVGNRLRTHLANFDGEYYRQRDGGGYLERTCAVGSYPPNAFGLHDMHGNVWQWCADWYEEGYYLNSPRDDPRGPASGTSRVTRGGCWDAIAAACRAAYRIASDPEHEENYTGFRVALDASAKRR